MWQSLDPPIDREIILCLLAPVWGPVTVMQCLSVRTGYGGIYLFKI